MINTGSFCHHQKKLVITTFIKEVKNEAAQFLKDTVFFSYFHTAKKIA